MLDACRSVASRPDIKKLLWQQCIVKVGSGQYWRREAIARVRGAVASRR